MGKDLLDNLEQRGDKTGLSREESRALLALKEPDEMAGLLQYADRVRRRYCGDEVHLRALLEFSNICRRQCNYCGLRSPNDKLSRYRMSPDEIVATAEKLAAKGLQTIVLQSGEDPYYTGAMLADIVRHIKQATGLAITLSVGERPYADYQLWREAGADRYLLRHETANPEHYRFLHPDSAFEERRRCTQWLRELGYQVGIGCMVGSPGQTIEHLVDDIEFIQSFQPDMVGIGPFIPHPNTPLGDYPAGELQMILKMVALARIVTKDALIPATTAVGTIDELGRELALEAGADVVMPNYTPPAYRTRYEIYPNKRCVTENPQLCDGCLRLRIMSVGRTVAAGPGHSRKRGGLG